MINPDYSYRYPWTNLKNMISLTFTCPNESGAIYLRSKFATTKTLNHFFCRPIFSAYVSRHISFSLLANLERKKGKTVENNEVFMHGKRGRFEFNVLKGLYPRLTYSSSLSFRISSWSKEKLTERYIFLNFVQNKQRNEQSEYFRWKIAVQNSKYNNFAPASQDG